MMSLAEAKGQIRNGRRMTELIVEEELQFDDLLVLDELLTEDRRRSSRVLENLKEGLPPDWGFGGQRKWKAPD